MNTIAIDAVTQLHRRLRQSHPERIFPLENGELTWSGGAAAFVNEAGDRYL